MFNSITFFTRLLRMASLGSALLGLVFLPQSLLAQSSGTSQTGSAGVGIGNATFLDCPDCRPFCNPIPPDIVNCGEIYTEDIQFSISSLTNSAITLEALNTSLTPPQGLSIPVSSVEYSVITTQVITTATGKGPNAAITTSTVTMCSPLTFPLVVSANSSARIIASIEHEFCATNGGGISFPYGTHTFSVNGTGVVSSNILILDGGFTFSVWRDFAVMQASTRKGNDDFSSLTSPTWSPNPSGERAEVAFSTAKEGVVSMSVYNMQGQEVLRPLQEAAFETGIHHLKLDLSTLAPGIYFTRIRTGEGIQTVKWIKL